MIETVNELLEVEPSFLRMACIDLAFAGGIAFKKGHERAGRKMISVALNAADMDADVVDILVADLEAFLRALPKHRELDELTDF